MNKRSLMSSILAIMGLGGTPALNHTTKRFSGESNIKAKGQLRSTHPKASGAAQLKRQAKKRRNISKR